MHRPGGREDVSTGLGPCSGPRLINSKLSLGIGLTHSTPGAHSPAVPQDPVRLDPLGGGHSPQAQTPLTGWLGSLGLFSRRTEVEEQLPHLGGSWQVRGDLGGCSALLPVELRTLTAQLLFTHPVGSVGPPPLPAVVMGNAPSAWPAWLQFMLSRSWVTEEFVMVIAKMRPVDGVASNAADAQPQRRSWAAGATDEQLISIQCVPCWTVHLDGLSQWPCESNR